MLPDRNILKTAKTILKIQDRLHPLLFGEDGYMLGETRQELLKKANFYIAKVLRTIRDVEVSDIILVALSAAGHQRANQRPHRRGIAAATGRD